MNRYTLLKANIKLRHNFSQFFHKQSIGGLLLLVCVIFALLIANIPFLSPLFEVWNTKIGISVGNFSFNLPLITWVNDALMAIFFFVVGLEIKREILVGELSSFKHAALPIFAAVGGMLVPALIYIFFNNGTPTDTGWGIPMATDIAFAIGIISLLGNKCPLGLKVFLTALAIVDDLGAILVIAIFYPSHSIESSYLIYALFVVLFLIFMNRMNIRSIVLYIICGLSLWYFVFMSGIHATIAGVVLAMTIPSTSSINEVRFYVRAKYLLQKFKENSRGELRILANRHQTEAISALNNQIDGVNPMLHRIESVLHPWVTFFIMPIFALANAGVVIDASVIDLNLLPTVSMGILLGLFLGKPIGILLFSYIAVKLKFAVLPTATNWKNIASVGIIAGIGFTMSIFIANLAFSEESIINLGKITILVASFISAIVGLISLKITLK